MSVCVCLRLSLGHDAPLCAGTRVFSGSGPRAYEVCLLSLRSVPMGPAAPSGPGQGGGSPVRGAHRGNRCLSCSRPHGRSGLRKTRGSGAGCPARCCDVVTPTLGASRGRSPRASTVSRMVSSFGASSRGRQGASSGGAGCGSGTRGCHVSKGTPGPLAQLSPLPLNITRQPPGLFSGSWGGTCTQSPSPCYC